MSGRIGAQTMTSITKTLRLRILLQGTLSSSGASQALTSSLALRDSFIPAKRFYSPKQPGFPWTIATSRNAPEKPFVRGRRSASFLNAINADLPAVGGGQSLGEGGRYVLDRKLSSEHNSETWLALDTTYANFTIIYTRSSQLYTLVGQEVASR